LQDANPRGTVGVRNGFFVVRPEPAGHRRRRSGDIDVLALDTWLGDDMVRAHPLVLVTALLMKGLEDLDGPTGFAFRRVRSGGSRFFRRNDPGRRLPRFWAVEVSGAPGVDDFGFDSDGSIVVSQRVLDVLMRFRIRQATLAQFAPAAAPTARPGLPARPSPGPGSKTKGRLGS
jgi:hypothetical protein